MHSSFGHGMVKRLGRRGFAGRKHAKKTPFGVRAPNGVFSSTLDPVRLQAVHALRVSAHHLLQRLRSFGRQK